MPPEPLLWQVYSFSCNSCFLGQIFAMANTDELVTEAEVVASIHKLVKEGDPAKLTNRTLMNDIEEMFGKRLGPLQERLKNIVRMQTKAIADNPDLLNGKEDTGATTEKTEDNGSVVEAKEKEPSAVVKEPSLVEQKEQKEEANGEAGAKDDKKEDAESDPKDGKADEDVEGGTKSKIEKESEKGSDDKDKTGNEDEDDEDEEFKVDDEDGDDEDEGTTTKKRRKSSSVKEEYDSDEEPIVATKRRAKRTSTKEKVKLTAAEADVKKYLKLCRELGCRFPVGKFKGVTEAKEKRKLLVAFLEEKGVDVKGERMTQGKIRKVRKRLDRDKELAGLDTDNIISEGRAKRQRTTVSYADKDEEEEAVDGEKSPPPPTPERESDSEEYKEESGMDDEDD